MQKKFQNFPNFLVKNWQNFARDFFFDLNSYGTGLHFGHRP